MERKLVRPATFENLNMLEFQKSVEEKYSLKFATYWEFHKWSTDNIEKFWEEAWNYMKIVSSVHFSKVIEPYKSMEDIPEWFPGSKMNYAENLLQHDSGTALIVLGEENPVPTEISYKELRKQTAILTAAFLKAGIKKDDVVTCFMSNRVEAILCMLATASVGALFTAANPLMGVKAVISRFHQVKPKALFTVDRHVCNGEERNVMNLLPGIVEGLPTLEYVVIVPSNKSSLSKDISGIPKSCFYDNFFKKGLKEDGSAPSPYYEQLPFSHPFTISFTSGTTGPPKGVVHSAGGMLMVPLKDLVLHFNLQKSDVLWTFYLVGWMSWNYYLTALSVGSTIVIYEGFPFFNGGGYWNAAEKLGATIGFLIPNVLEEMRRNNLIPKPNTLKKLRLLVSASCPVKAHIYDFVYGKVKKDILFTAGYGSTETMSMVAGIVHSLPVYIEEHQAPSLGMSVKTLDEKGENVVDELGELVITKPFPSMPLFFWNDELKKKYKSTFFEKYPGVFCHADMAIFNSKTGGLLVTGRTDETIKQKGARFGSAEIYEVVNKFDAIADSVCVSWKNENMDEVAVLFVKLKPGHSFTTELVDNIKKEVKNELSYRHVPEVIKLVKDIPYNVNGKKMEVLVKKILAGLDVALDTVGNLDSIQEYKDFVRDRC